MPRCKRLRIAPARSCWKITCAHRCVARGIVAKPSQPVAESTPAEPLAGGTPANGERPLGFFSRALRPAGVMNIDPDFEISADMRLIELQRISLGLAPPELTSWQTRLARRTRRNYGRGKLGRRQVAAPCLAVQASATPTAGVIPGAVVTVTLSIANEGAASARKRRGHRCPIPAVPAIVPVRSSGWARDDEELPIVFFHDGLDIGEIPPGGRAARSCGSSASGSATAPLLVAPTVRARRRGDRRRSNAEDRTEGASIACGVRDRTRTRRSRALRAEAAHSGRNSGRRVAVLRTRRRRNDRPRSRRRSALVGPSPAASGTGSAGRRNASAGCGTGTGARAGAATRAGRYAGARSRCAVRTFRSRDHCLLRTHVQRLESADDPEPLHLRQRARMRDRREGQRHAGTQAPSRRAVASAASDATTRTAR